jgi:molybdopterin molybdotransferase
MQKSSATDLLTVEQAIHILDQAVIHPRVSQLNLADAHGLRLAQDIIADRDDPPFDKSQMDGYAVRSGDGSELTVIDTIAAGHAGDVRIEPGQAAAIMTGAPLPAGADAVVPVERTTRRGDRVIIEGEVKPRKWIAPRGSDIHAGNVVLTKGTRLGPTQIAVAAAVGASRVQVFARPVMTVLSTGDELVEFDQTPVGGQIRNSNCIMLVTLLRQMGCDVQGDAHIADDLPATVEAIRANCGGDALFITGGMSMGEFDFVPKALQMLGAKIAITKLRIKPGKPFVYATLDRADGGVCHVFGLPGNPVSAFVCTVRLASRVLTRLAGGSPQAAMGRAQLISPLPINGDREFYQPAIRSGSNVEPLGWKSSADIYTLARANVLIVRAENAPATNVGDWVDIMEIPT